MASDIYNTGYNNVTNAANQGKDAISAFNPEAEANKTASGFDSLFNNQQKTQNDYIQRYKDSIYANPKATDLYNTGNAMFNVPALQQQANTLNNAVLQTPQQTIDRAKGFNFDANQVGHQTNQDLARLSPLAIAATNSANTASGLAKGYVDAGMEQNQMNLLPVQQEGQMMSDLFARQASGYTTAAQQRFEGLTAKMQAGVQLSTEEMKELSSLAQSEQNYQSTMAQVAASTKNTQIANQFHVLGNTQGLYNANSGKMTPYTYIPPNAYQSIGGY